MAKCYHINTTRLNKLIQYLLRTHLKNILRKIVPGCSVSVCIEIWRITDKFHQSSPQETHCQQEMQNLHSTWKSFSPCSLSKTEWKSNDWRHGGAGLDHWKVYVLVFSARTFIWFPDQLQEGDLQQPYTLSCVMNTKVSLENRDDRKCGEPPRNYNINRR